MRPAARATIGRRSFFMATPSQRLHGQAAVWRKQTTSVSPSTYDAGSTVHAAGEAVGAAVSGGGATRSRPRYPPGRSCRSARAAAIAKEREAAQRPERRGPAARALERFSEPLPAASDL